MLYYFTEISKYLLILIMGLYVIECIIYEFKDEDYQKSNGISVRQRIYILLLQGVAYATLCLKTGQLDYLFLMLFTQIIFFAILIIAGILYPRLDKILLNNMVLLLSIGSVILSRLDFNKALRQFFIEAISLTIGIVMPVLITKISKPEKYGFVYAGIGIGVLLAVFLLAATVNGSKISYSLFGITIQPSELVKIIYIFCVAALIGRAKSFLDIVIATSVAAVHVLILVLSRDLGSGLIYFTAYLFMLFIGTRSYIFFGLGLLAGSGASVIAYRIFSHVQVRVRAFKDPFSVIEREGYQISQSLFAISTGSFLGMGLTKGTPTDIPFVESDFIFSAVAEELGVIFGIELLLVCLSCFIIMMKTSMVCGRKFNRLLAGGFGVMYIFQVFLTVGGGIKFIPLTGVTLPFVSYGGSSVLSSVIIFFIMEWIIIDYRDREYEARLQERESREEEV